MPTSTEELPQAHSVAGPFRLGKLLNVNLQGRLHKLANAIAARHGEPKPPKPPSTPLLAGAARKLVANGSDLEALTLRERKAAIELFWVKMEGWEPSIEDLRRWLAWASLNWGSRIGIGRIATSYLRNFDPTSEATLTKILYQAILTLFRFIRNIASI